MESEKVKEIKKWLENKITRPIDFTRPYENTLTLINELESENDTLHTNLCEYRRENKELKEIVLNKAIIDKKVGEMVLENQQLKDRIAELENELEEEKMCSFNRSTIIMLNEKELEHLKVENERLANRITCQVVLPDDKLEEIKKECLEKVELAKGELLKQFAERLKEKAIRRQEFIGELAIDDIEYVKTQDIDKTLKEFI